MDPFVSNSSCRGPFRIGFGAPVGLVMTTVYGDIGHVVGIDVDDPAIGCVPE